MSTDNSIEANLNIGLLTETSWEVCNKIGGIYTVLSTKAVELKKILGDSLVFIGPDFREKKENLLFKERKSLLRQFSSRRLPFDIQVRVGRWDIPGSPLVVLVDFQNIFPHLNEFYGEMWEAFRVDSLHAYGDYDESCAFSIAAAIVGIELASHLKVQPDRVVAHFNEWTTGMGLLYVKRHLPEASTVFTTHATTIGRSICGNGKPLYQYFLNYNGDQMAAELNVESKHSLEKAAAVNADCFTTVSDVTARECEQLLGIRPHVVTPNGFEPSFVPECAKWQRLRKAGREKLLRIASMLHGSPVPSDSLIIATSGRNEFRNKGLDLFLDSMMRVAEKSVDSQDKPVVALVLVPAWVRQPSGDLLVNMDFGGWIKPNPDYLTHRLNNEDTDAVACKIREIKSRMAGAGLDGRVIPIYVPSYLDGFDGIVEISYYDLLPAIDLSVFASYYEPWGYTPLESIAFGVPTVTTDKAGFGQWAREIDATSIVDNGVAVICREDTNYCDCVEEIADIVRQYRLLPPKRRETAGRGAMQTADLAQWRFFISKYLEAFQIALNHPSR